MLISLIMIVWSLSRTQINLLHFYLRKRLHKMIKKRNSNIHSKKIVQQYKLLSKRIMKQQLRCRKNWRILSINSSILVNLLKDIRRPIMMTHIENLSKKLNLMMKKYHLIQRTFQRKDKQQSLGQWISPKVNSWEQLVKRWRREFNQSNIKMREKSYPT